MLNSTIESSQLELQGVYDGVRSAGISAKLIQNEDQELLAVVLPNAINTSALTPKLSPLEIDHDYADEAIWELEAALPFHKLYGLYPPETLELLDLIVGIQNNGELASNLSNTPVASFVTLENDLHIDGLAEAKPQIPPLNIHVTKLGEVAVQFGLLRNLDDFDFAFNRGWESHDLEISCPPFSEPYHLVANDVVIFRGTGSRPGLNQLALHPVAHNFVSLVAPRLSDVYTPIPDKAEEVIDRRNNIIKQFDLERFGYQVLSVEPRTAA